MGGKPNAAAALGSTARSSRLSPAPASARLTLLGGFDLVCDDLPELPGEGWDADRAHLRVSSSGFAPRKKKGHRSFRAGGLFIRGGVGGSGSLSSHRGKATGPNRAALRNSRRPIAHAAGGSHPVASQEHGRLCAGPHETSLGATDLPAGEVLTQGLRFHARHRHSWRRATMGSSMAARRAG